MDNHPPHLPASLPATQLKRRAAALAGILTGVGLSGSSSLLPLLVILLQASRALATLLAGFALVVLSLTWPVVFRADQRLLLAVNRHARRLIWMDRLMFVVTQIGNGGFGLLLALALALHGWGLLGVMMAGAVLTLWPLVEMLKWFTACQRPFIHLPHLKIIGWRERSLSFPSGHTAQAFLLAVLLDQGMALGGLFHLGLYALALLVGLSRMYIGMHFPRDVAAGALIGSAWGLLVYRVVLSLF